MHYLGYSEIEEKGLFELALDDTPASLAEKNDKTVDLVFKHNSDINSRDLSKISDSDTLIPPPPIPARPKDLAPFSRTPNTTTQQYANTSNLSALQTGDALSTLKQDSTSTVVGGSRFEVKGNTNAPDYNEQNQASGDFPSMVDRAPPPAEACTKRKWIGKWQLGKTIGEGSSGKVKLAEHAETKETCVVKAVRRPKLANGETASEGAYASPSNLEKIYKRELYMIREACLGMILHHPNIVKMHSAVLGENHFYCFFEHVPGEDLVDYISREGALGESRSRDIFRKVVSAIEYAHRNHVVHRDIKLENIRYNSVTGVVKLLDFGFAAFYNAKDKLETNCGSPCYAAPEIYDNKPYVGPLVDVWSLAVCLFGMVTGTLPFDGPDFKSLASKVRSGKVVFPDELSRNIISLLTGMLKTDPKRRSTMAEVASHPWVNIGYPKLPLDYEELHRDRDPVISTEWVNCINKASVCQAGCMLMEELEFRMPSQTLAKAMAVTGQATDEDDSMDDAEAEASKFVSNMTIKERRKSNIWWKRLFRGLNFPTREEKESEVLMQQYKYQAKPEKGPKTIGNIVDLIRGDTAQHTAGPKKTRFRAFTNTVVNLFTPEMKSGSSAGSGQRHTRWSVFKRL